jgi:hypothetical protein
MVSFCFAPKLVRPCFNLRLAIPCSALNRLGHILGQQMETPQGGLLITDQDS